jgi:rod shape-determining protein MreC
LVKENARLHNMQPSSFESPIHVNIIRSILAKRYNGRSASFSFMEAKVVNSSVTTGKQLYHVTRGKARAKQNGVMGPDGIVGKVILVSENYSRVMSLLNRKSKVNAMLKKDFIRRS